MNTTEIPELAKKAIIIFKETGAASPSILQRKLRIGYGKASLVIGWLEENGKLSKKKNDPACGEVLSANREKVEKALEYNAFAKLSPQDWVELLPDYETQADAINAWKYFDNTTWAKILAKESRYNVLADNQNIWEKFDNNDWLTLLRSDDEYIKYADKYNAWAKLKNWDWCRLLSANCDFIDRAKRCKAFEKFDSADWKVLICSQPQFARFAEEMALKQIKKEEESAKAENRPPKKNTLWDSFSGFAWASVIVVDKKFFLPIVNRHNGFEKFSGEDWALILNFDFSFFKNVAEKFSAFQKLDSKDWKEILVI